METLLVTVDGKFHTRKDFRNLEEVIDYLDEWDGDESVEVWKETDEKDYLVCSNTISSYWNMTDVFKEGSDDE